MATVPPRGMSAADYLDAPKASDFLDAGVDEITPSALHSYLRSILTPALAPQLPRNIFDNIPATSNVFDSTGNALGAAAGNSNGQSSGRTGLNDDELQRVLSSVGLAQKAPLEPFVKSIQKENARQIALDQPMAAVDGHGNVIQEPPLTNPEANQAEFAKLWQTPTEVTRAALTDAMTTALLPVTYPLYGAQGVAGMQASLPTALRNAFRDTETNPNPEPLPVDVQNTGMSQQHPVLATVAKVGQSAAGSVPLAVVGGAPAWAQKLLALGFSAQMIASAGPAARTLGTELGKNPEDRDNDAITSSVSDLVQDFGFAPFAGLHGIRDIVERYADKPMYVIRKLSDQLQNAPIPPPASALDPDKDIAPVSDPNPNEAANPPAEKPISQKIDDLTAAVEEIKAALSANQIFSGTSGSSLPEALPDGDSSQPAEGISASAAPSASEVAQPGNGKTRNALETETATSSEPFSSEPNNSSFSQQAEHLAQKLESLKTGIGDGGQLHAFGLVPDLWDRAVTVAQNVIRAGGSIGDAINEAIRHVRTNFTGSFDEAGARAALSSSLADTGSFREWGKYDLRKVPIGSDPIARSQSFPKSETQVTPQQLPKTSDGLQLWAANQLAKLPGVLRSPWGNKVVLHGDKKVAAQASQYISGGAGFGPSRERAAVLPMVANTIRNAMASATVRDRPWSAYLYRYADGQLHAVIVDDEKGTVEKQFVVKPDPRDPNFGNGSDLRVLYRNGIEGIPWETLALEQLSKRRIPLPSAVETSLGSQKIDRPFNRLKLEQFETSPYGQFRKFPRDRLAGHELLQNAWLRKNGHGGPVFPQNPAMALPQKFHAGFVTPMQYEFGLHHRANLARMTAEENILFNAEILRRLNVPHAAIEQAVNASLQYAKTLSKPGQ